MSRQRRKDHKRIVLHEQNIKEYERLLSKDFLDFIADDMAWYGLPKYKGILLTPGRKTRDFSRGI